MTPFARDGHLTDLGLELHLAEQVDPAAVVAHLEDCALCRTRVAAARAHDEGAAMPAFIPRADVAPPATAAPANRTWMFGAVALAATALLAIGLSQTGGEADDEWRVKGSRDLALQVYLDEGEVSTRLRDGDGVEAGDRLGFRIHTRRGGHLLVVGVDARSDPYLCYPQHTDGRSAELFGADGPTALPEAIRMDETPGIERLVAILCDAPFEYSDVRDGLTRGSEDLRAGCDQDELILEKLP